VLLETWQTQSATALEWMMLAITAKCEMKRVRVYIHACVYYDFKCWLGVIVHVVCVATKVWLTMRFCKTWKKLCEWILVASQSHNFKFMSMFWFATSQQQLIILCRLGLWIPDLSKNTLICEGAMQNSWTMLRHSDALTLYERNGTDMCTRMLQPMRTAVRHRLWH
jgi:hypothetical protein